MSAFVSEWILTLLIAFPMLAACALFALPAANVRLLRWFALGASLVEAVLSLHLVRYFVPDYSHFQFAQTLSWLPESTGIRYIVGVDGLSLLLLLLTTLLSPLIILSTFSSIENRVREFLAIYLFLEAAMVGTFAAVDLVLFYVFWEAMLIPMYFLIGVWGGNQRIYATMKFFVYTAVGSLLMLVAFGYLYYAHGLRTGTYSTNLVELFRTAAALPLTEQYWLFGATVLAFAIKVPLFPLHTWLPDAHVEAPTAGSVVLAGILLKMGTYGLMRFSIPMFPMAAQALAPVLISLGVIGILYGALIAWRQTDIKKLVAYSSVSHLGFVVAGMFALNAQGFTGALYQMVNHGVSTGALFLLVGALYERRHTRELSEFGGLAKVMPWFSVFFMAATLGSVALPGTGGFVGEFMILWGIFQAHMWLGVLATTGVILGAVYMLWLAYKVIWGPVAQKANEFLEDVSLREGLILGSLSVAVFAMGIFPAKILDHAQATLLHLQRAASTGKAFDTSLAESDSVYRARIRSQGTASVNKNLREAGHE